MRGTHYWRGEVPAGGSAEASRPQEVAPVEQFIHAVDSYIRWYNHSRIKISLGALSPVEYHRSLGMSA